MKVIHSRYVGNVWMAMWILIPTKDGTLTLPSRSIGISTDALGHFANGKFRKKIVLVSCWIRLFGIMLYR
jgi:hypothetical protein